MKNKKIPIIISIILLIVLFYFLIAINTNNNNQVDVNQTELTDEDYLNQETTFEESIDIEWTGQVRGCLLSCEAYSVELMSQIEGYQKIYLWALDNDLLNLNDKIKITGKWVGITCAYHNTVFGQCVPEVVPEKIEKID